MTSILMVPVYLDALLLQQDQAITEAMTDFSRLPYFDGHRDVNADTVNISEEIVSQPFEDQNLYLKAGIHLHWALPDTLTRGLHTSAGTTFPTVPNRWLVIRSRKDTSGQETTEKMWVVESDYLYPDGTGDTTGSISMPFMADSTTGSYRPFRYQGRRMPLESWQAHDPQAHYLDTLTAVGYGEPTFAAFYPNCHSVFGFYDDTLPASLAGLLYYVIGWYSDTTRDPFAAFVQDFTASQATTPSPEALRTALERTMSWTATISAGQAFPQQMLCYARLAFDTVDPSALSPATVDPEITLAVGNTGIEALSAYLASQIDLTQKATIEDQLEALQAAFRLEQQQLDIGATFAEARHENGFAAHHGGLLWTIVPETDTAVPANAQDTQALMQVTLPEALAEQLDALNLAQQRYDQACQDTASLRRQLFSDWYKYMLCAYPPDDTRDDYPDIDEVRYYIEEKTFPPLEDMVSTTGELTLHADASGKLLNASASLSPSLAADLAQALNIVLATLSTFNGNAQVKAANIIYTIGRVAAPRFWQPREPVVLMHGASITPDDRHGHDGLLACQVLAATATVQDLIPGQIELMRSAIAALNEDASIGLSTWMQQPWHPFLLDWEVEILPMSNEGNLQPETTRYQPDFISSNYTLPENQPDLALSGQGTLVKASAIYSGSSILTPYASGQLAQLLQEYLNDPQVDTTTATYQHLKAASALLNAPGFYSLSQALGGFNEALLMHKQIRQLEIDDPLGFADYQDFTRHVHADVQGQNKSAPQPLLDFHPLRSGIMRVLRLRLIDTFGQARDLQWENVITTSQMSSMQGSDWVTLVPRITQPARLAFRWLAATSGEQEMNAHPTTTPICGWVLPNNLDNSLMIYDPQGKFLGLINTHAQWDSTLPGGPGITADAIPDLHLRKMVNYLVTQGEAFLANFLSAVDTALANIDPENFAQHQDLALLIGRPVALVRVALSLELQGLPAIHQGWNNFRQDLRRTTRDSNGFTSVEFPLRLGEYQQLNDGVVGYWKEAGDGYEDDIFYAPQSDPLADEHIKTYAADPAPIRLTIEDTPLLVSMLLDPRGSAHATAGILPTNEITLPPDQYTAALQALEVFFLSTPFLTDVGKIQLPLPVEEGYQWSWAADPTIAIEKTNPQATFSSVQEIREGWLKLSKAPETPPAGS